jgi:MFS family permease
MVGNYLNPIYIVKTLRADGSVMGYSTTIYAIGAVAAGLTLPYVMKKWGLFRAILLPVSLYTVSMMTVWAIPAVFMYLLCQFFNGWGNAGTRVARNTIMMEVVPNALIGRVNSFISCVELALRVSLIGLFTQFIGSSGPSPAYGALAVLLVVAFSGIFLSRTIVPADRQMEKGTVA